MKSYAVVVWSVAALALTTMVAPTVDAHGLRGHHDGSHDAHEEHAPFFGYDLVPERAAELTGSSSLESELMADPDYDASEIGREDDEDEEEEEAEDEKDEDSEDGSEAMESDLSDDDDSETFGFDALERGGSSVKNSATQSVPAPLPNTSMSSKPAPPPAVVSPPTTPPPIGESAAAAKDITSIDSSAIQQDPKSYGVATKAPETTPPPIGESAAAAKDITSIDSSAIQQDPKSYGVDKSTPPASTPLNESPAAAKPLSPAATPLADSPAAAKPTQTTAENSPKQRSNDVDDGSDELDH